MKTVQESNKKSFREKIFSTRSLFIIFILLPVLIVGIGFSAWSAITPNFSGFVKASITSERLIDTNGLMKVTKFEPYTKQLFVTGPVDGDGKLLNELHFETKIELKTANIHTLAKDCGKSELYLSVTLSLKDGTVCPIFYDLEKKTTHFRVNFNQVSQNASNVGSESVSMTVTAASAQPNPTTSSVTLLLVLSFNNMKAENPFSDDDNLEIIPEFVLGSSGYETFFDLAKEKAQFRLELSLNETAPAV